ncbi:S8 family peptidase [Shewanella halifaxensis]|uniref:S8 family peptidase n=1 Tax=Shewanella halifaxensis TaxID=271098 RepID=UPI0013A650E6|nr:S8 family serine peptidase [Shewanella halifaxensis]
MLFENLLTQQLNKLLAIDIYLRIKMKKNILLSAMILILSTPTSAVELIVNWKDQANAHNKESIEQLASTTNLDINYISNLQFNFDLINVKSADIKYALTTLENTGLFSRVELNGMIQIPKNSVKLIPSIPGKDKGGIGTRSLVVGKFNDPLYLEQYYLEEQEEKFMGLSSLLKARDYAVENKKIDRKVRIAVLDTGKWLHEDMVWSKDEASFVRFYPNQLCETIDATNSGNDVFCDEKDLVDAYYNNDAIDKNWYDGHIAIHGHGLAVASQISALSNNGKGMVGIIPQDSVELVPVKVLNGQGAGGGSALTDGMLWAMGEYTNPEGLTPSDRGWVNPISAPVDIINLSLGGSTTLSCEMDSYFKEAISLAYEKNISVVIAAGNEFTDTTYVTPANCTEALTVASSKIGGDISVFSNYGQFVDIAIHGEEITTAHVSSNFYGSGATCGEGDVEVTTCYSKSSGTSMSTPNISASIGLLKMVYPDLTAKELETMLLNTAVKTNYLADGTLSTAAKVGYGAGVANVYNALMNNPLAITKVSAKHHFDGYESQLQQMFVSNILDYVPNACEKYDINFGLLQHETAGIHYEIVQTNDVGDEIVISSKVPRLIVDRSTHKNIAVRSCKNNSCNEFVNVDFNSTKKPSVCNI